MTINIFREDSYREIKPKHLKILHPRAINKLKSSYFAEIRYKKHKLHIQTPNLMIPFDCRWNSLTLSLSDRNTDTLVQDLYLLVSGIDTMLQHQSWDIDKSLRFRNSIRKENITVKIQDQTQIYSAQKELLSPEDICAQSHGVCILLLNGVWFRSDSDSTYWIYGTQWILRQMKLELPPTLEPFAILDVGNDARREEKIPPAPPPPPPPLNKPRKSIREIIAENKGETLESASRIRDQDKVTVVPNLDDIRNGLARLRKVVQPSHSESEEYLAESEEIVENRISVLCKPKSRTWDTETNMMDRMIHELKETLHRAF